MQQQGSTLAVLLAVQLAWVSVSKGETQPRIDVRYAGQNEETPDFQRYTDVEQTRLQRAFLSRVVSGTGRLYAVPVRLRLQGGS